MPVEKIVVITMEALPVSKGKILIAQSKPCFMRSGKHYPTIKPDAADLFDGLFSTRGDAPGYYISHPWC